MARDATFGRPPGWLGGVLEAGPFLAATATAAIGVRWMVAYPQGLAIAFVLQEGRSRGPGVVVHRPGFGPMAAERGVVFDQPGPELRARGDQSGIGVIEDEWWFSPLPAGGGFDIVVAWPREGIAETRFRVGADVLRRAVEQARPVLDGHG